MADRRAKQIADSKLKTIYSQYYSSIYKYCLAKLKNDRASVEDCVQESFIVLYKRLLNGEEIDYPHAFLLKAASNMVKRRYEQISRDEKNIDIEEIKEITTHSVDIDDRLTFEEYSRMISDALNDTDREIFILRYIQELKIEDIAAALDLSVSNVATRLSRMRNKLREVLKKSE